MSDLELHKSASLYRRDIVTGENGLTLAAILLLGTEQLIMSALPHYKTDAIVRKNNVDRYEDRVVIQDNLIKSYDKLMDFVVKHLDDRFYIEGTQRIDVRNKIFREVCANMLIRREFSSAFPAKFIIGKKETAGYVLGKESDIQAQYDKSLGDLQVKMKMNLG